MKINLIPTKKLAMLSAAVCAAMLAFSHNASAVTFLGPAQNVGNLFPPAVSDAAKTAAVNHLIVQARGTTDFNIILAGEDISRINRTRNTFGGALPTASVTGAVSGTGTNIPAATIGSGIYSYLFATYANQFGPAEGVVYYIGNLSGDITIPAIDFNFFLTGWTLITAGGQGVPDGGTTVMLLGAALGALSMARRFLKI